MRKECIRLYIMKTNDEGTQHEAREDLSNGNNEIRATFPTFDHRRTNHFGCLLASKTSLFGDFP